MEVVLIIIGLLIIVLVIWDVLYTTLVGVGAGPLSTFITKITWKLFFNLAGKKGFSPILNFCGAITISFVFITWIILYWAGNSLIVISNFYSLADSTTGEPIDIWGKIYFTGYTLSTLGLGDIKPANNFFRIYTAVASLSGFAMLSMSITYFLTVVSANANKQATGNYIALHGASSVQILTSGWNGTNFKDMETSLSTMTTQIIHLTQQLTSYPIIPNFHAPDKSKSISLNIARLSEALSMMQAFFPKEVQASEQVIVPLQNAITTFFRNIKEEYVLEGTHVPPVPLTSVLQNTSLPCGEYKIEYYDQIREKRRLLYTFVTREGWKWEDVWRDDEKQFRQ